MTPELDPQHLVDRATRAAADRWPDAQVSDPVTMDGGISSLTFGARLTRGATDELPIVIKVAPPGLKPTHNRDVLRHARVMRALADAPGLEVPEILFEDDGDPPLFAMRFVPGQAYEPKIESVSAPPSAETIDGRARAAARMLAALHTQDPRSLPIGDEPTLTLEAELTRWAQLYTTVPDDLRGPERELLGELETTMPDPVPARIVHGDYRLANILFDGDTPRAVIDWEIWSVGDPRTDIAWLLMHADPVHRLDAGADGPSERAAAGMPKPSQLFAEYSGHAPQDADAVSWFLGFCHYKAASTIAAIVKRGRRQAEPPPQLPAAEASVRRLVDRGLQIVRTR